MKIDIVTFFPEMLRLCNILLSKEPATAAYLI